MARIELPAGAWAELRDPDLVTEGERQPLLKALSGATKAMDDGGVVESMIHVQNAVLLVMVESWSFDAPVEDASLQNLPVKIV